MNTSDHNSRLREAALGLWTTWTARRPTSGFRLFINPLPAPCQRTTPGPLAALHATNYHPSTDSCNALLALCALMALMALMALCALRCSGGSRAKGGRCRPLQHLIY